MSTAMGEKEKVKYVAVEDLASDLGIPEADLLNLLRPLSPPIKRDHRGRAAISTSYKSKVSSSDGYLDAIGRALSEESRARFEDRPIDSVLRQRRARLLDEYEPWIAELQAVHQRYLAAANIAGAESSGMASYLLLSRGISTLKTLQTCLKEGHWYSGSLLRDIDETLDLALYFAISDGKEKGQRARRRWFRENVAPKHEESRKAISEWGPSIVEDADSAEHLDVMRELYGKKSKWTHPTYASIREITEYVPDGSRQVAAIDYGPCRYERKLCELTDFFRSSIWSTFQVLYICFHYQLDLSEEDTALLLRYDRMFRERADGAYPMDAPDG